MVKTSELTNWNVLKYFFQMLNNYYVNIFLMWYFFKYISTGNILSWDKDFKIKYSLVGTRILALRLFINSQFVK